MTDDYSWHEDALCKGLHTDLWFPPALKEERSAPEGAYYSLGKLVCEQCVVRRDCDAFGENEEQGLWGGRTPKERRNDLPTRWPKLVLPRENVHRAIPKHDPNVKLFIPETKYDIKQYLRRRKSPKTNKM